MAEIVAGFAGGITGGATAMPGAIPTIWCNLKGLSKIQQRAVIQPFILLMQIATMAYFSSWAFWGRQPGRRICGARRPLSPARSWGSGCSSASMTESFAGLFCFSC